MLQEWRTPFNELQQDRRKLMIRLNAFTPGQLEFQPAPNSWSLLQVLEHLVLTEQAFLQNARERLAQPSRRVTPRENVMALVVRGVMDAGIKIKTPGTVRHVMPERNTSLDTLRGRWSETRDEWEQFLEQLSPDRRTTALFHHPVSGGMTPSQTLKFVRSHIHHHYAQIDRLVKLSSKAPLPVTA